ncbi:hypothetical protein SBRCBS47491_008247 [Sporothrix bragantina]|uniref:Major facilitator superfamily (MFS) profile domain-containing protein n=1 Tax=Sporothrix bragantina TaxID=671064 RepID=A0ABP0CJU2_9PEZI
MASHNGLGDSVDVKIEKSTPTVTDITDTATETPVNSPPPTDDDTPVALENAVGVVPEIYNRFGRGRKRLYVAILSLCAIVSPISSTGSLTAVPSIASDFGTTGSVINIGSGLYVGMMGLSALVWGPMSTVTGRRPVVCTSIVSFFVFSVATAVAPSTSLAAFFIFRMLTGFGGTGLLIAGSGCIGDLYPPTARATALGWFQSGVLIGPAIGPVLGGVLVTYTSSWRSIFWFQSGVAGLGALLALFVLPETIHTYVWAGVPSKRKKARVFLAALNPLRLAALFKTWNVIAVALASSSLVWNMYSYLTPIVYVINPRVGLTTPLQAGLMYLAPGSGYLLGTFLGGRWADYTVRKWIGRRNSQRLPEDRLRSMVPWMGVGVPACMLIYGWLLEYNKGGLPAIVVVMFIQGFCQLMVFPALNTYCLDVMPSRSAEVIAGNYFMRYVFAAVGSAVSLPAINKIGVGWFSTISAVFLVAACLGVMWVIHTIPSQGGGEETTTT